MLIGVSHPSFATTGGAEVLLARQVAALRARGHELRLVTMALDPDRWPELARDAEVRLAPKHWTDALAPGLVRRLRRRVRRQVAQLRGVDVVLASGFPANLVAADTPDARSVWYCNEPSRRLHFTATFPALAARVRASAASCDSPLFALARRRIAEEAASRGELARLRAADVEAVRRLDCVVANSRYAADRARDVYGRAADMVVHPTVPGEVRGRHRRGLDPAGLQVLTHSRLDLLKNVETVVRGFAAFAARHPGSHVLHVVGTGGDAQRLRALAAELGLGDAVRFHGFLAERELDAVYDACDVMTLLPPDEPFGMVFPEAALRGLLLVGPDHGGPLEILDGGALGWAVDAFSPEALAESLAEVRRLSTADADRRRERAAAACRDRYGEAATVPRLLSLLTSR